MQALMNMADVAPRLAADAAALADEDDLGPMFERHRRWQGLPRNEKEDDTQFTDEESDLGKVPHHVRSPQNSQRAGPSQLHKTRRHVSDDEDGNDNRDSHSGSQIQSSKNSKRARLDIKDLLACYDSDEEASAEVRENYEEMGDGGKPWWEAEDEKEEEEEDEDEEEEGRADEEDFEGEEEKENEEMEEEDRIEEDKRSEEQEEGDEKEDKNVRTFRKSYGLTVAEAVQVLDSILVVDGKGQNASREVVWSAVASIKAMSKMATSMQQINAYQKKNEMLLRRVERNTIRFEQMQRNLELVHAKLEETNAKLDETTVKLEELQESLADMKPTKLPKPELVSRYWFNGFNIILITFYCADIHLLAAVFGTDQAKLKQTAAQLFYSPKVESYSAKGTLFKNVKVGGSMTPNPSSFIVQICYRIGSTDEAFNNVAQRYIISFPLDVGPICKTILDSADEDTIKSEIWEPLAHKLGTLRCNFRDYLHESIVKLQTLPEVFHKATDSYEVPMTSDRIRRFALLRCYVKRIGARNSDGTTKAGLWKTVDEALEGVRQREKTEPHLVKADMKEIVTYDKKKYGEYSDKSLEKAPSRDAEFAKCFS
ncbi:unnamed protein product [Tilletia controversa]|nr:unnamed protein product [Tilletia controversa]